MISKNAKKELIDQDLTVNDLAKETGYTAAYISGVINGRLKSSKAKKMIAFVLQKDFDYLWSEENENTAENAA